MSQNYINHVALVLDASGSMNHNATNVVNVADNQIAYLAQRSKELDQETRVTIYTFEGNNVTCLIYDKDVLRLPSIKGLYKIGGMTNLIDATLKSLDDLEKTAQLYGDHAFLAYVLTDGAENMSRHKPADLVRRLKGLPENWTVACFVPNQTGVFEAKGFGFPADNIAVWDTTSAKGVESVGATIRTATDNFMRARATGVRSSRNLFNLTVDKLTSTQVKKLDALTPGQFRMLPVDVDGRIDEFVERKLRRPYKLGEGFYQPTKPVTVQAAKEVAIFDKKAYTVYTGKNARTLLGLPTHDVKVNPTAHPNYTIFIQSTSVNRKLFAGTNLLVVS